MSEEWAPSWWGRSLTRSPEWRLLLNDVELSLAIDGKLHAIDVRKESSYRIRPGLLWTSITLQPGRPDALKVDGLPNAQGKKLIATLPSLLAEIELREDMEFLQHAEQLMAPWLRQQRDQENRAKNERLWLTHEMQTVLEASRPAVDVAAIRTRLNKADVKSTLGDKAASFNRALFVWESRAPQIYWPSLNAEHTERELEACRDLFASVERKPLSDEQARAAICFDNRIQVVAAAGSGKTSTMVAKAAYAIQRGFVAPERIILLAFNKQAAEELKDRAARSFERLGMKGVSVEALTFHALGLRIIGQATGQKPGIPDWATNTTAGLRKLTEIIDQLKDQSRAFRQKWDLFRFVFFRDIPKLESFSPAELGVEPGKGRVLTADGKLVRSQEEAIIANWLFYNGVNYVYEVPYKFKTADEGHRQYRPDFYYPDIDLYHEHFALNARGEAPPQFPDYGAGVRWKRELHKKRGTSLVETASHQIRAGTVFTHLANALTVRGIKLDPNPDRTIPEGGQKPMAPDELTSLVRTFISHVKSNCLTIADLHRQVRAMPQDTFKHRYRMFLDIVDPILRGWDAALADEDGIDFEDMLNLAALHLENGDCEQPYELVMADEFQDASRARARLCRALVQKRGRFFFAVGDDWQSINRFAGADVSVMTGFREWFGHGQILKLEQTFRCPQELCDVSSRFISRNPAQIAKAVRSVTPKAGPVLQAFQVDDKDKLTDAIERFVAQLAAGVQNGKIKTGTNGKVSVFVLGRYNADKQYLPTRKLSFERWVDVSFLTIHRSKGSEADYVILPEMLSLSWGRSFPSTRADDPVLALAMPSSDEYPLGEERRLFYVALTRARRSVALFTVRGQCSSFLTELEADGAVTVTNVDGEPVKDAKCPSCKQGVMMLRKSKHGEFSSCSNFPVCRYKRNGAVGA